MRKPISLAAVIFPLAALTIFSSIPCFAQKMSFHYSYKIAPAMITEAPHISAGPEFKYPEEARKTGVEGKVILTFTLGEDSKVRDIKVVEGLPGGVTEALTDGIQKMVFTPAKNEDAPAPVDVTFELNITLLFDEADPNVKKPRITFLPTPPYPDNQRAGTYKGKVTARILFFADGTLKVDAIGSVLPKEFDNAAMEAAKTIKFEPAVHKKSQKPVSQIMIVTFDFKP